MHSSSDMKNFIRLFLLLILICDGCIEPYPLNPETGQRKLVVDGMISDQPGPYSVKLSWSNYTEQTEELEFVSGALVRIVDESGHEEVLTEMEGIYQTQTQGFQGVVGKSYQLKITIDGKAYATDLQEMKSAGDIDEIIPEFAPNAINLNDPTQNQDAVNIFFNSHGTANKSNHFRWRWSATYEFKTNPELHMKMDQGVLVKDPLECSGYIVSPDGLLVQVRPCICCNCYITEFSSKALVSDDQISQSGIFKQIRAAQFPADAHRFANRFYIKIEQISLSDDVYAFWNLAQVQQESAGNIFQPNVVKIRGNVKSVDDSREEVLGVFSVSAIVSKDIFFDKTVVPKPLLPIFSTNDCRLAYEGASNVKPPFW
jgi:hypothetical protein